VVEIVEVKSYDWTKYTTPSSQRRKANEFADQREKMAERYGEALGRSPQDLLDISRLVILGEEGDLPDELLRQLRQRGIEPDTDVGAMPSRIPKK
jgi:hypothetical protein